MVCDSLRITVNWDFFNLWENNYFQHPYAGVEFNSLEEYGEDEIDRKPTPPKKLACFYFPF